MDSALSHLYESLRPQLVASLTALTGDMDLAEECADEAFARAVLHWPRVRKMESPTGWIYTVAINIGRRACRRRRFEQKVLHRQRATRVQGPEAAYEFWALIHGLPERQRVAITLRYVSQFTEPEIAQVMNVKRGTVSATLRSAHENLRESLGHEYPARSTS